MKLMSIIESALRVLFWYVVFPWNWIKHTITAVGSKEDTSLAYMHPIGPYISAIVGLVLSVAAYNVALIYYATLNYLEALAVVYITAIIIYAIQRWALKEDSSSKASNYSTSGGLAITLGLLWGYTTVLVLMVLGEYFI